MVRFFRYNERELGRLWNMVVLISFDALQAAYLHEVRNPRWRTIETILAINVSLRMLNGNTVPLRLTFLSPSSPSEDLKRGTPHFSSKQISSRLLFCGLPDGKFCFSPCKLNAKLQERTP